MIIFFIFILTSDVNLSINIDKTEVEQGTDIILHYEIDNGHWFYDVNNLEIEWIVLNKFNQVETNGSENYKILKPHENRVENIKIDTSNFNIEGKHTIWVHLDYWINGKWESKHLSVEFTIK